MIYYENNPYDNSTKYDKKLHTPYNYVKNGFLSKMMSHIIYKNYTEKNPLVKEFLDLIELKVGYLFSKIDKIKYFKNYKIKNY